MTTAMRQLNREMPGGGRELGPWHAGVRGDEIPAGPAGNPPWMYRSLSLPADASKLYRYWIESHNFPFGLPLAPDSTGVIPGLPAGVYTATVHLIQDDVILTPAFTVTHEVAAPPPPPPPPPGPATTITFDAAYPHVLPYVNGCPDIAVEFHLRQAAIEFFQRTLSWREDLPAVTTVAGQSAYTIEAPSGSVLVKLLSYTFDGRGGDLVDSDMGKALVLAQSGAEVLWSLNRVNFTVSPTPDEAGKAVRIHAALKPSQAATGIPAALFEQYVQYVAHGALSSLMRMPNQPWTNEVNARYHEDMFEDAIERVSALVSKSAGRSKQRVRAFLF